MPPTTNVVSLFTTPCCSILCERRDEQVRDIFHQLFKPVVAHFRFLDEETSWTENLEILGRYR
jgi:hypothetical protein